MHRRALIRSIPGPLVALLLTACGGDEPALHEAPRTTATTTTGGGGSGGSGGQPEPQPAPLVWAPCDTSTWPAGYPKPPQGVVCTTVDVPLDHAAPEGPTLALRVARQPASEPSGRAVFQIAGGPGGSAVNQTGLIPGYLPDLSKHFDLVYVDARGTGASGYLDCSGGYPDTQAQWEACGAEHAADPLDHYMSVDAAHDLDLVRRRMGYERIGLRAGSYGTRLALEYLRQHADGAGAVVLDGVVPTDDDFFGLLAKQFDLGIEWLVADCAADPACLAVAPDVGADLASWRAAVAASPRPIEAGGSSTVEDEPTFLEALEVTLYDASLRFRVPRAIHTALAGDHAGWNSVLSDIYGVTIEDPTAASATAAAAPSAVARPRLPPEHRPAATRGASYVSPAVWMAVVCAEMLPNAGGLGALEAATAAQTWPSGRALVYAHACASWNVTPLSAELLAPVAVDAPVLALSGALDLKTPPAAGAHAAASLPGATHLVVPYTFHGTLTQPCVAAIMTAYFEADGDAAQVDTTCLAGIQPPPW